jgi:hypothetical protein
MVTGNDVNRKLKIVKETLVAVEEIYSGHLPEQDKCEKIVFLLRTMFECLNEGTDSECSDQSKK